MFKLTFLRQIGFVSFLLLTVWYLGCQAGLSESNGDTTPNEADSTGEPEVDGLGIVVEPPDEAEVDDSLDTEGQGAPPVADAGENQVVFDKTLVILDGSGSSDPDGDPLTLTWKQPGGPAVTWDEDSPGIISFVAPDVDEDTHLEFTLSVSDGIFTVDDTVSVQVMNTVTPADVGLPEVRFTVLLEEGADPADPLDGPGPLNVICSAATMDGQPLPEGTFTWMFDGVPETGPTDTYATRTHTFTAACAHTVALSLTVSGLAVGCLNTQTVSLEARPTVWPSISGKVLAASGAGVSGATVSANAGGTTSVTAFDGTYGVHVPCEWSGKVTAQHVDYIFEPSSSSYVGISTNLTEQDFEEPAADPGDGSGDGGGGDHEPPVVCVTDADCDDAVGCTNDACVNGSCVSTPDDVNCDNGLFCDGAETCDAANDCLAGQDPCPGQSCDEENDTCAVCAGDADCDDGLFCNGPETCVTDTCQDGIAPDCDDGVGCTDDSCNEGTDSCDNVPNNGTCDNGLFCDGAETCDAINDCQAGTPAAAGTECDDGVACTLNDECSAGECTGTVDPDCEYTTYYVAGNDPNADDDNPGTEELPFKTIQRITGLVIQGGIHQGSDLQPGDTVILRGGVTEPYDYINPDSRRIDSPHVWIDSDGTANAPITMRAYPGEQVTIDAQHSTLGDGPHEIVKISADYITFEGITVTDGARTGVDISGSYVTLRDCVVYDTGTPDQHHFGIYVHGGFNDPNQPEYVLIEYCESYGNGHGLQVGYNPVENNLFLPQANYAVVRFNYFHHNVMSEDDSSGIGLRGIGHQVYRNFCHENSDNAFAVEEARDCNVSQNLLVRNARINGQDGPQGTSGEFKDRFGKSNLYRQNTHFDNKLGYDEASFAVDNSFLHNISYGCQWGMYFEGDNSIVLNNISYDSRLREDFLVNSGHCDQDPPCFVSPRGLDYNFIGDGGFTQYAGENGLSGDPEFVSTDIPQILAGLITDVHDPAFASLPAMQLQETSTAINAGDFLMRTTDGGSATTVIPVDGDPSRFFWVKTNPAGISDTIQLEGAGEALIVGIDSVAHTITVDRPLTFDAGAGVSLPWLGTQPDMGAYEFGGQ